MSTFTSGPWAWDKYRIALNGANGSKVLSDGEGYWSICGEDADADLISAAPDYYAATQVMLAVAEHGVINDLEGFGRALRLLRAAQAKANGEKS